MLKKGNVNMLSGSIFRGLISMTIPIMVMNVVQNMFNIVDMTVLGQHTNDTAVGAVGACSVLISLCTGLFIGVSTGANVVVSQCIGAGKKEHAEKAIGTAILFSCIGGVILVLVGIYFADAFLRLINCPESLFSDAVLYFKLYLIGSPMLLIYNFCASILRAGGDTKRPMYFLFIGGGVKLALNYFCITSLNMTVDGAGISTIISNTVMSVLALYALVTNKNDTKFKWEKFRLYNSELKSMLVIGVPAGIQTALYSFANTVIVAAVNDFGPDAATGVAIANQFDGVLYHISCATSLAATPYVAQNIGARNFDRTKKAILCAILITVMFGEGFGILSAVFCRQLSSLMSATPAVIEYSCQKMIIISSTYFICGIKEVLSGTLRGMGKPIVPTISTFLFMFVLRFVWVYCVFPFFSNITFLYLVWPVGWILCIITELTTYFIAMSKMQKAHNLAGK